MKKTFAAALASLTFITSLFAAETLIWTVNSREDVLKGDSRGVSIGENGTISISPAFTSVYKTEQPYIWSSAIDQAGNVFLGTGTEGRIFRVAANGTGIM